VHFNTMALRCSLVLVTLCAVEAIFWIGVFSSRESDSAQRKWVERDSSNLKLAHRDSSESETSLISNPTKNQGPLGKYFAWFEKWALLTLLLSILAIFVLSNEKIRPKLPVKLAKQLNHLEYFAHPKEVLDMLYFKLTDKLPQIPPNLNENDQWCFKKLIQVSRSFSAPILALDQELSVPVKFIPLEHLILNN
jgi:hypothetical protein